MLRSAFSASSEGGPYIITDASEFARWRGTEGRDYARVCRALGNRSVSVATPGSAFLNVGPGTIEAYRLSAHEAVLSSNEEEDEAETEEPWRARASDTVIGELTLDTGVVAVAWSAVSFAEVCAATFPKGTWPDGFGARKQLELHAGTIRGVGGVLVLTPGRHVVSVRSVAKRGPISWLRLTHETQWEGQPAKSKARTRASAKRATSTQPSGRVLRQGDSDWVAALAWNRKGWLATCGPGVDAVRVCDSEGSLLRQWSHRELGLTYKVTLAKLAFSADGDRLAIATGTTIVVLDVAADRAPWSVQHGRWGAQAIAFRGNDLVTASSTDGIAIHGDRGKTRSMVSDVSAALFAHHPNKNEWVAANGVSPSVCLGRARDRVEQLDSSWIAEGGHVTTIAYSPRGETFALGFRGGQVGIYSAEGREIRRLDSPSRKKYLSPTSCAMDHAAKRIWVAYEDNVIRAWNVADGSLAQQWPRFSVAFVLGVSHAHSLELAYDAERRCLALNTGLPKLGGSVTLFDL